MQCGCTRIASHHGAALCRYQRVCKPQIGYAPRPASSRRRRSSRGSAPRARPARRCWRAAPCRGRGCPRARRGSCRRAARPARPSGTRCVRSRRQPSPPAGAARPSSPAIDSVVGRRAPGDAEAELEQRPAGTRPAAIRCLAISIWPKSNTSSSGFTPTRCAIEAMRSRSRTRLTTTASPKFMLPQSSVQISGSSSATCRMRSAAVARSVPAIIRAGSSGSSSNCPPMPAVRFSTMSVPESRTRATTSRNSAGSRAPSPVVGSRTCTCAIGCAGPCRLDAGGSHLRGRHRHARMLADRIAGAGHGTGQDHLVPLIGSAPGRRVAEGASGRRARARSAMGGESRQIDPHLLAEAVQQVALQQVAAIGLVNSPCRVPRGCGWSRW